MRTFPPHRSQNEEKNNELVDPYEFYGRFKGVHYHGTIMGTDDDIHTDDENQPRQSNQDVNNTANLGFLHKTRNYDHINDCYQFLEYNMEYPEEGLFKDTQRGYGSYIFFSYIEENYLDSRYVKNIFEKSIDYYSYDFDYSLDPVLDILEKNSLDITNLITNLAISNVLLDGNAQPKIYQFEEADEYNGFGMYISNSITTIKDSVLTFDNELMIWAILNEFKYLSLINGMWAPKTNDMIENDLIKNFKFLNLNERDFINFLKNKKEGWRYFNRNTATFFVYRYQANSLKTFKDSKNFEANAKQFILSTSPIYGQQIAIPIEEFDRLKKKFIEYKSTNFKKPEIIILEKLEPLTQKIVIKKQNYCKLYDGNIYILYSKKNPETECIL